MSDTWSAHDVRRYSRHLLLPEFGARGQKRLKAGRVLCIGAGGLGSPAAIYLAAAGVGRLGVVDFDVVDESNLQRQILHRTADVGRPKTESAKEHLLALNPGVDVVAHTEPLTSSNALQLFAGYDVVLDGTDNPSTRYLINDAAVLTGVPVVSASVFRMEGQLSVFAVKGQPCYRCLYPSPAPPHLSPTCGEGGVLGVVTGVLGTLQATEVIKLLAGFGEPMIGRLLLFDASELRFRELTVRRDPACVVCGDAPTVTALVDYESFCGVSAPVDVQSMTVQELAQRLRAGTPTQLVDVREPLERDINGIAGALGIPLGELEQRFGELEPEIDLVVFCKVGERSARAVASLQRIGFRRVWNLTGGVEAWVEQIDDLQDSY